MKQAPGPRLLAESIKPAIVHPFSPQSLAHSSGLVASNSSVKFTLLVVNGSRASKVALLQFDPWLSLLSVLESRRMSSAEFE